FRPSLPFALEKLEVINGCSASMWAWVRRSNGSAAWDKVQQLDIDLCDEEGKVCIKLRGFSSRVLEGEVLEQSSAIERLMLQSVWKEKPVDPERKLVEYVERRVFLRDLNETSPLFQDRVPSISFTALKSDQKSLEGCFEDYSIQLFDYIQKLLQTKPQGDV